MASAEKAVVGEKLVGPNSTAVDTDSDDDTDLRPLSAEQYVLVSGPRLPDWASKWGQCYHEMRRHWEKDIEISRDRPTFRDWLEENPDKARSLQEKVKKRLKQPSRASKSAVIAKKGKRKRRSKNNMIVSSMF